MPTPRLVRLRVVRDIHAEPDVQTALDVQCYGDLPRAFPRFYVAPQRAVEHDVSRRRRREISTASSSEGRGVDADGDADVVPDVAGGCVKPEHASTSGRATGERRRRRRRRRGTIDWENVVDAVERAWFLNNALLARDAVASRLVVCRIANARTSLDGAVWDDTRFFADRLDGRYETALRRAGLLRSVVRAPGQRPVGDEGKSDDDDDDDADFVEVEEDNLCWSELAGRLVAEARRAGAEGSPRAGVGHDRDGPTLADHFTASREVFSILGAFYEEVGTALFGESPGPGEHERKRRRAASESTEAIDSRGTVGQRAVHHDKLLTVLQANSVGYYHWMIECLPKLAASLPLLNEHPDMKVLVPSRGEGVGNQAAMATVTMLGLEPDRVVFNEPGTVFRCKELYFVSFIPNLMPPSVLIRNLLRRLKRRESRRPVEGRPSVILIDRDDVRDLYPFAHLRPRRRLVNHAEVLAALEEALSDKFDIVPFRADCMGFDEMVGAFGRAAAIVGVHGAGLSNAMFATRLGEAGKGPVHYGEDVTREAQRREVHPGASSLLSSRRNTCRLVEIVPGASSFHSEYVLLGEILGMEHHAYMVPGVGWGDDIEVSSPRHLASVVRAALLPEEVAQAATGGRHERMFEALHGRVFETGEDDEFDDARPFVGR